MNTNVETYRHFATEFYQKQLYCHDSLIIKNSLKFQSMEWVTMKN